MPPQVADAMPWRRKLWLGVVLRERDAAQREAAERQEDEADRQRIQAEHDKKMAEQGLTPGGLPLGG